MKMVREGKKTPIHYLLYQTLSRVLPTKISSSGQPYKPMGKMDTMPLSSMKNKNKKKQNPITEGLNQIPASSVTPQRMTLVTQW